MRYKVFTEQLPESCSRCIFISRYMYPDGMSHDTYICKINGYTARIIIGGRMDTCPLIECKEMFNEGQ